ncbi:MAG: aldo/keto reductase [Acidobacteriia bacterium]|nr:aldo/keto reductase [Terriglobia bacterium]
MLPGHATPAGTARFSDRFPQLHRAGHFRRIGQVPDAGELWLSSIGLGTYLGEPDDDADQAYVEAIVQAVRSGVNVLDTAINYRHQRSERNIGAALAELSRSGELNRNEVLVCTKAGYLSFDGSMPADPRGYFMREYVEPGVLDPKELAGGMHCMAPGYLENQIERSRKNLGLETIDVFYVHNPESQLADVSREVFHTRLKSAFAMLENQVKAGTLCYYGMATWNAFRVAETDRGYVNLFEVAELAREVGGEQHHFRFVQLPFNLAMPEAYVLVNQVWGKKRLSLLDAGTALGIAVVGSATLYQGKLTHDLPDSLGRVLGTTGDAHTAIQFSRSASGLATSLIGMGNRQHVEANLKVAEIPPADAKDWTKLFGEPQAGD